MPRLAPINIGKEWGKRVTMAVRVVGVKRFYVRLWCAKWIVLLAAKVAGCGVSFDCGKEDPG